MSLFSALATLPTGRTIGDGLVSSDTVTKHLRERYIRNREELRRKDGMRKRIAFYNDAAHTYIRERVLNLFQNELTRELRLALVDLSLSNNVTKRITNLTSTVYSSPAKRLLPFDQEDFDDYQRAVKLHKKMRRAQRIWNLCNAVVIYPMFKFDGSPSLRVVDPSAFHAVSHPLDSGQLIGLILDLDIKSEAIAKSKCPRYLVIDDTYRFFLDRDGHLFGEIIEHNVGRIPAVFAAKGDDDSKLLDSDTGSDIISAHEAITILRLLAMKNAKSGAKQAYLTGDTSEALLEQARDEEQMLDLPDGVGVGTIDLNASPEAYLRVAAEISNEVFGNRGIPEPLRTGNTRVTSGDMITLLKAELAELRRDDLIDWRDIEHDRADLEEKVFGFDVDDYHTDFAETTAPRTRTEQLSIDKEERNQGRSNIIDQMRRDDPDLTEQQAWERLHRNIRINGKWIGHMRSLNIPANASAVEHGNSPQANGRLGSRGADESARTPIGEGAASEP